MNSAYQSLIENGMPAEDARGLLPHSVTTRLHYKTNLRNLLDHAGNRLCTQAQFEWKSVFALIKRAIREYKALQFTPSFDGYCEDNFVWQQEKIADLFEPICYQTGKCEFASKIDRPCKIKNRVDANADLNRLSSEWGQDYDVVPPDTIVSGVGPQSVIRHAQTKRPLFVGAIRPVEWLADPFAAR